MPEGRKMIEVRIGLDAIHITGHAGYAPPGQDIVCAGISALFVTLVESIQRFTKDKIMTEISPGCSKFEIENPSDESKLLMGSFILGVRWISDQYPNNAKLFVQA
jgi:uncharacterized protein YsxB (DUF464 family)